MADQQHHPITPPPELMRHWSRFQGDTHPEALWFRIANEAAQWSADKELEACCKWLIAWDTCEGEKLASFLREGRRPKPPSLKEQALVALEDANLDAVHYNIIRRALEDSNG